MDIKEQIERLSSPQVADRIDAIKQIGASDDPAAIQPLVDCLSDVNWGVRRTAAHEVARFGEPAIDPLLTLLEHENRSVRRFAVQALALIRHWRAAPHLLAAYRRDKLHIPDYAAKAIENALRYIGEPESLKGYTEDLGAPREWERRIHMDLEILGLSKTQDEHSVVALAEAMVDGDCGAFIEPLVILGKPAVPVLIHLLENANSEVRACAIDALIEIGDIAAVGGLSERLTDWDRGVEYLAAHALRKMGTPEALRAVAEWEARKH